MSKLRTRLGTRDRIQAAAVRLLQGKPTRSKSYALTITNLAQEAGLGRATLNRVPDLRDEFKAAVEALRRVEEQAHPTVTAQRLREEIAALREQHSDETMLLRRQVTTLANQVQALKLLLEHQEARAATGIRGIGALSGQ
jgi:hypothetical protein